MTNARELYEKGKRFREEQPTLWAILRGRGNPVRLALVTGLSLRETLEDLAELEKQGHVRQSGTGAYVLDMKGPDAIALTQLKEFYVRLEVKLVQASGVPIQSGMISGKAEKMLAEANPELMGKPASRRAKVREIKPTAVQLKLLKVIWDELRGEPYFRATAVAKAQGYTQAGWTKKYLETLERKGFIEETPAPGRGTAWKLTELGVEWASNPKT